MYTVGQWFPIMMNLAILAIVGVVIFALIFHYRGKYENEARGRVMVELKMPSGWSQYYVVKPLTDGWVDLGKFGVYKLAPQIPNREEKKGNPSAVITPSKQWDMYPRRPFLGMRRLQVPIRKEEFYLNNPEPITWPENKVTVTSVDAKLHSKEMMAEHNAASIAETDAHQRKWDELVEKINSKFMLIYILAGGAILVGIINLIQYLSSKGG
jgi:hypothetical protein